MYLAEENIKRDNRELPVSGGVILKNLETPECLADRYEYIGFLGQGAQGKVYLARRIADDQTVAIKELKIDSVKNWKEYELFRREADVLKNLKIDGVARFYEAPEYLDVEEPCAYIVQEYIEASSLEVMMKSGFRFSLGRIFLLAVRLIDILEQLHTHVPTIIHRDIKPANILMKVCDDGSFKPYLIDFGAVSNPQVQSGGSTVAGTYGYMPPEQLMGKPVPASDIYALAALLAYLLTGVEPGEMQVTDFHLIIDPYMENIPNPVISTLHAMLEPKCENRLCDYRILRARFLDYAHNRFGVGENSVRLSRYSLADVHTFGQRGNIDLWMELPDAVPRSLPNELLDLKRNGQYEEMTLNKKITKAQYRDRLTCGSVLILLFGSSCILVTGGSIGVLFLSSGIERARISLSLVGVGVLLLTLTICFFYVRWILYPKKSAFWENTTYRNFKLNENNDLIMINWILVYGSKCIATVVDFSYIGAQMDAIEPYPQFEERPLSDGGSIDLTSAAAHGSNTIAEGNMGVYNHDAPRFRLRYKFNPPDDNNPDDLIHEIICHEDYSNRLKRGTPLPILYLITDGKSNVISMPFPFPLDKIVRFKDIYCTNEAQDRLRAPDWE